MFFDYLDYWLELSDNNRMSLLDTRETVFANSFFPDRSSKNKDTLRPIHKKEIVRCVLNDVISHNRMDVLDEIYSKVLSLGFCNSNNLNKIEYLRWWNYQDMKGDYPSDRYWLLFELSRYYSISAKNNEKSLEIARIAYSEIDSYIEDIKEFGNYNMGPNNTMPQFFFARDEILFRLLDLQRYDECKSLLEEMRLKGYFDGKEGEKRWIWYCDYFVGVEIEKAFHEKNIDKILLFLPKLFDIHPNINKDIYYKKIGDIFFENKDYKESLFYYQKAKEYNPKIFGLKGKLKVIMKKI